MLIQRFFLAPIAWALLLEATQGFSVSKPRTSLNLQRTLIISSPSSPTSHRTTSTSLQMSLKPGGIPLMDSGKALARSGEFIVDMTNGFDNFGGALSASGANIRNAGDSLAQAGASCRYKTAAELVCNELREAATCLQEATDKLELAAEEAEVDKNLPLQQQIIKMVQPTQFISLSLEAAGRCIMQRSPVIEVGEHIVDAGNSLEILLQIIRAFSSITENDEASQNAMDASARMAYASEKMIEAGKELQGIKKEKPKGRAFLKG